MLYEGRRGGASARVQYRNVSKQIMEVLLRACIVAAGLLQGPSPGRQEIPARPTGGFRVGRDHRHTRPDEIAPIADAFRIALPHEEDDRRGVWGAVVGQSGLPVE